MILSSLFKFIKYMLILLAGSNLEWVKLVRCLTAFLNLRWILKVISFTYTVLFPVTKESGAVIKRNTRISNLFHVTVDSNETVFYEHIIKIHFKPIASNSHIPVTSRYVREFFSFEPSNELHFFPKENGTLFRVEHLMKRCHVHSVDSCTRWTRYHNHTQWQAMTIKACSQR